MSHRKIVRAAIHPGIGIARVGNSLNPEGFFIGPEVPYAWRTPKGGYKDAEGALRRQAARCRVFGYDAAGRVVQELTADDAEICWTVHVANKKAAWYAYELALDVPGAIPCPQRNADFTGEARKQLVIDPGPRPIQGRNESGPDYHLDTGTFFGRKVYLGELRTDERGRLIFLGGRGVSDTAFPHNAATTFANNDGWYDDISDGPVLAEVRIGGDRVPCAPAWVVVAPPNYAPDIITAPTMDDVLYNTYQGNWLEPIQRPSFTWHIYPILRQLCDEQWVNYGAYVQFGWGAPYEFLRPDFLLKLAENRDEYAELRRQIFHMFRHPAFTSVEVRAWPQHYGDEAGISDQPRQFLALPLPQYNYLKEWAAGNFEADWDPTVKPPRRIEDVNLEDRPNTLDRAAMTYCMGGPFHPGCEMSWPMRHETMYHAPYRIRPRAPNQPEPDYGDVLTPEIVMSENGPLYENGPGDITRWMAVPWQTDTANCRAGYDPDFDPYLPTFWPARVPNHVLAAKEYRKVMDLNLSLEERLAAFSTRSTWLRGLKGAYVQQMNRMIPDFARLGVVERREGPPDESAFPPVMYVESPPELDAEIPHDRNTVIGPVEKVTRHRRGTDRR